MEPLDDGAYDAFLSFGVLPTPSASPELVARLERRDLGETENALFALAERGLATRQSAPGSDLVSYQLHDLAHAYARANSAGRVKTLVRAALDYLEAHKTDVEGVDLEIGNLLGAAERSGEGEALLRFMCLLAVDGTYYEARGHTPRSLKLLRLAVATAEAANNLRSAHFLSNKLGNVYSNVAGAFEKALTAYRAALTYAENLGDRALEAVGASLVGLTLMHLSRHDEATRHMDRAYELALSLKEPLSRATVFEQRGYFFAHQSEYKQARPFFEQSLNELEGSLSETSKPETFKRVFFATLNLGEVDRQLGDVQAALAQREAALNIARKNYNQLWEAHALLELGELQISMGETGKAQACWHAALHLYEKNEVEAYVARVKERLRSADLQVTTTTTSPEL